jgi:hypothetical protein
MFGRPVAHRLERACLQRVEIVPRTPLGRRAGEDRHVAAAIVVLVLDAPFRLAVAIRCERHLGVVGALVSGVPISLYAFNPGALGWALCGDDFGKVRGLFQPWS